MRFFHLLLLILFFNPFQLTGEKSPVDPLFIADEINWLKEHSGNIRYAANPSWGLVDFIDANGDHKGIIADYIRIYEDKPDASFRKIYDYSWPGIDSLPEKVFFERNIKLLLLLAGLFLLVALLIFSNISILKHQVRKKTAELKKQLIEKEKARLSSRKNESRLNSIFKIYNHKTDSVDELLEYTIKQAVQLTDSKSGMLYRFDRESGSFILSDFYSVDNIPDTEIRPADLFSARDLSICSDILKKEVVIINKKQLSTILLKNENCPFRTLPVKNLLGIPVVADGNTVDGVFFIANKEEEYDRSDAQQSVLLINSAWRHMHKQLWHEQLITAKEKAEESDRLKSNFLQNMSHEIRTPLNAIVGFSQLMTDPQLTEEEHKIYAAQIHSGSDKLTGVIKDIIEISQLQSGQTEITNTEFDLMGLITELTESVSEKAKDKNLELTVNKKNAQKKYNIKTDREKLRAILIHLIDNAVKFTPKGSVKIITDIRDDRLHFSISDTGIGISPETQKIIFEPFRQSDTDTCRKFGGNGLGLSLVRAYTDLLGGTINLESKINKGTTVTVSLPARTKAADEQVNVPESNIRTASNVKNKKDIVIIAEDEYANFLYLKKLLKEDNIHVLHAKDGYEVIDLCRNDSAVNLIFMGIKMPNMDGHTAAKMIKEFRPDLPIIAQTAYALESDKLKFTDVFDDYLTKPVEKLRIKQIIRKYGSAMN